MSDALVLPQKHCTPRENVARFMRQLRPEAPVLHSCTGANAFCAQPFSEIHTSSPQQLMSAQPVEVLPTYLSQVRRTDWTGPETTKEGNREIKHPAAMTPWPVLQAGWPHL